MTRVDGSTIVDDWNPDMWIHRHELAATSCVTLAGCGGGGKDNAPNPPSPAIVDNVLMSTGPAANGVAVTINQAGYIRAFGVGTDQPLTFGLGSVPMTGNANSATGNGWLPSSGTFIEGNATLSSNSGASTYSLKVQGANNTASDSTLALNNILVKPTVSSLAGTYGIPGNPQIVIAGTSFSGTYGNSCTWGGNLMPQNNTVDVTDIQFQAATQASNPAGNVCPYVEFHGNGVLNGA